MINQLGRGNLTRALNNYEPHPHERLGRVINRNPKRIHFDDVIPQGTDGDGLELSPPDISM